MMSYCASFPFPVLDQLTRLVLNPLNNGVDNQFPFSRHRIKFQMARSLNILALAALMVGLGRPSLVASFAIESNDLPKCPMVMAKAEETCVDSKSTCWSPGQKDVDCLDEELCCFDGCAHHCK